MRQRIFWQLNRAWQNSKAFMNFKQAAVKEFSANVAFKPIYMQMCNKWQQRSTEEAEKN